MSYQIFTDATADLTPELLEGLPQKYRAVLHLYYYEGYATGEIAAILGRSPNTVRSQLARGRALLRDAWKGAEEL